MGKGEKIKNENLPLLFVAAKKVFGPVQFYLPRFLIAGVAVGLLLCTFSYGLTPKNACEISKADAEKILGSSKLIARDKSKLLVEEGKNSANVRCCSYAIDEHIDIPSLGWINIEFNNEQEAKENYIRVSANHNSERLQNRHCGNCRPILLNPARRFRQKKISIAARKGKNVFMVIAHLTNSPEKSVEDIKTPAKKIADKTSD